MLVVSDTSVYDRHSLLQLVVSSPKMQILLVARNTIPHIPLPELHSTNGVNLRMNNEDERDICKHTAIDFSNPFFF